MRTAVTERNAETLCVANHDVGPPLPGRREQHEAQEIGRDSQQRVAFVHMLDRLRVIDNRAVGCRILHESAKHFWTDLEIGIARDAYLYPAHAGASLHHVDRLRVALRCDEENFLSRFALERVTHRHRFSSSGRLIE